MKQANILKDEERTSIGLHKSTREALGELVHDMRVSTYEEAILKLFYFYKQNN